METLKEKYTFLAVFHDKKEMGYLVNFPDMDECFTFADTIEHGKILAKEALEYCIHGRQEHNDHIPEPCKREDINITCETDIITEITADMTVFRENMSKDPVDRDEHIPDWLANIAKKNRETLKDALDYITLEIERDLKKED